MSRGIVKRDHPALRKVAEDVPYMEDVSDIVRDMQELCAKFGGVGLAANQVAELKRIIVVKVGGFRGAIINPVITKRGGGQHTQREGCLSFPGLQVLKVRDKKITVEGFNEKWEPVKFKLSALAARVVQHEIDHLDGIVIADTEAA